MAPKAVILFHCLLASTYLVWVQWPVERRQEWSDVGLAFAAVAHPERVCWFLVCAQHWGWGSVGGY